MFIAHIPAGYLATRVLLRRSPRLLIVRDAASPDVAHLLLTSLRSLCLAHNQIRVFAGTPSHTVLLPLLLELDLSHNGLVAMPFLATKSVSLLSSIMAASRPLEAASTAQWPGLGVVPLRKELLFSSEGAPGLSGKLSGMAILSEREIVTLDDERKAAMVSNLLVVLCGESDVTPVLNAGGASR